MTTTKNNSELFQRIKKYYHEKNIEFQFVESDMDNIDKLYSIIPIIGADSSYFDLALEVNGKYVDLKYKDKPKKRTEPYPDEARIPEGYNKIIYPKAKGIHGILQM